LIFITLTGILVDLGETLQKLTEGEKQECQDTEKKDERGCSQRK